MIPFSLASLRSRSHPRSPALAWDWRVVAWEPPRSSGRSPPPVACLPRVRSCLGPPGGAASALRSASAERPSVRSLCVAKKRKSRVTESMCCSATFKSYLTRTICTFIAKQFLPPICQNMCHIESDFLIINNNNKFIYTVVPATAGPLGERPPALAGHFCDVPTTLPC